LESETRLENLEELKNSASQYKNLEEFLEKVALVSDIDNYREKDDVLTLMTVHSAKGMEFPVVFITGLEEGLFPHIQSLDNQLDLEEERRLFYVGMTRAMNRLYISYSEFRISYGRLEQSLPSRFVGELPENEIEFIEL
jgi:DNA helicase-2/ATP-dependent DNA helicase PcrA